MLDAEHAHGNRGLFGSHGVEVANRQHGQVRLVQFTDDLHVAEGTGIACMIDFEFVLKLDHKTSGITAIGSILGTGGMDSMSHREFDRSEERRVGKECRSRWSRYHEMTRKRR